MHPAIVCFEGASSIGKTTLSEWFSDRYTAVPEVNLLFERKATEPKYWYHQRQVDRYQMARASPTQSILDGDVFQPIWYNWACRYPPEFLSKEETHAFYKSMLAEEKIAFPDLYLHFHVEESVLWKRKERDKTRRRRNFEKHLRIIKPSRRYFDFLAEETELNVKFVPYTNLHTVRKRVATHLERLEAKAVDGLRVFEQIEDWISKNTP